MQDLSDWNILIVEDEKKVAGFIRKGLEEETYAVDVAYDGEEGFALAEMNHYDLVILDLMLPKMDGLEVLAYLRREPRLASVPVVVITSDDQPETRKRVMSGGATAMLIKPATLDALEGALQEASIL